MMSLLMKKTQALIEVCLYMKAMQTTNVIKNQIKKMTIVATSLIVTAVWDSVASEVVFSWSIQSHWSTMMKRQRVLSFRHMQEEVMKEIEAHCYLPIHKCQELLSLVDHQPIIRLHVRTDMWVSPLINAGTTMRMIYSSYFISMVTSSVIVATGSSRHVWGHLTMASLSC